MKTKYNYLEINGVRSSLFKRLTKDNNNQYWVTTISSNDLRQVECSSLRFARKLFEGEGMVETEKNDFDNAYQKVLDYFNKIK